MTARTPPLKRHPIKALSLALSLAALAACQPVAGHHGSAAKRADIRNGAQSFAQYCVICHGASARGDGPLAEGLPVAPADLTALASANDGAFPMSRVLAKIHGYPDRFHAEIMPQFGPLLDGPKADYVEADGTRVPTPLALLELGRYLESLQRP